MIDLTKITEPLGLLDEATQKALMEHGGPYEWLLADGSWSTEYKPVFNRLNNVIRVKPAPQKPREIWVNEYPEGLGSKWHDSQEIADDWAKNHMARIRAVRFVEVI